MDFEVIEDSISFQVVHSPTDKMSISFTKRSGKLTISQTNIIEG